MRKKTHAHAASVKFKVQEVADFTLQKGADIFFLVEIELPSRVIKSLTPELANGQLARACIVK
ncbi:MAG: hypothetical protein K2X47_12745 [Bdellovibrionales bacterium]|nr:hypothetical protein [Bdellovibrionales bacterium]